MTLFVNVLCELCKQGFFYIFECLCTDEAAFYSNVIKWYNEINRGIRSLQNKFCERHQKSFVVPANIDAVPELIM